MNKAAESDVWMGMKPNLRLSFHLVALGFVAILVIGCSGSQPSTAARSSPAPTLSAPPTLALVHGKLIDGTGAAPVADATVLIATDKIVAVGPAASTPVPSGVQTVDLHGAAILPGFINAHVHEAFDKVNLKAWAEGGVTTVRDESATPETVQGLKALKAEIATDAHLARMVSMGSMLKSPGDFELGIPMVEIEEMSASGMTPMQVIEASTRNGAHELRLDSQVGTVATGKVADILVVAGGPLADLQALRNVSLVVHNGTIIRDNLSR